MAQLPRLSGAHAKLPPGHVHNTGVERPDGFGHVVNRLVDEYPGHSRREIAMLVATCKEEVTAPFASLSDVLARARERINAVERGVPPGPVASRLRQS